MSTNDFIPVCEPTLLGNESRYVQQAISENWIGSQGKFLDQIHQEFPEYLGVKYGTTVSNGTCALHLALVALGIGPGDEVIVSDFNMIAPAFAIKYTGATPVFVDCRLDTWNMNVAQIEAKITAKTKAIMAVHIYGLSCEMEPILALAKKHNLFVIEDAAEAIGSEYYGKKCGSMGDINAFSFYSNKNITCGEGGFVATNDQSLYEKCLYYKNLCFPLHGPRNYWHAHVGFNYRLTNLQAAILVAQMERIEEYVGRRIENARLYRQHLKDIPGIGLPHQVSDKEFKNTYWMFGITLADEFGLSRDEVGVRLKKLGIDTRPFFIPMHKQPSLSQGHSGADPQDFPNSINLSERGMYLPSSSSLRPEQIERIAAALRTLQESR